MRTQKIKKHKSPFEFWQVLTVKERAFICVPFIALLLVIAWLGWGNVRQSKTSTSHALRESVLTTDGAWSSFEDYGFDVWAPSDLAEEQLEEGLSEHMKLYVERDAGKYPKRSVGVIVIPDEDIAVQSIATDINATLEMVRPHLQAALSTLFNGVNPTLTVDVTGTTMDNGSAALEAKGGASCVVRMQDPKDPENPYTEEVETNFYYLAKMFGKRPVVAWGQWDYSTYEGEEHTKAAVIDALNSLIKTEGGEIVEPAVDTWNTEAHRPGVPTPDPVVAGAQTGEGDPYWDSTLRGWVNPVDGTLDTRTPAPGTTYWEQKYIEAIGRDNYIETYGYVDENGKWVITNKEGTPLGPDTIPTPEEAARIAEEVAAEKERRMAESTQTTVPEDSESSVEVDIGDSGQVVTNQATATSGGKAASSSGS